MKQLNIKISVRLLMSVIVITILLVSAVAIFAISGDFAVPHTFTSGTKISASEMNANFQAIGQALPASKTGTASGTITLPSSGDYQTIATLAVTPPSNGYLQIFGRATVLATGGEQCFYISRTDSSGAVQLSQRNYSTCTSGNPGELNNVYPQGLVTAGTTLYFSLKAEAVGGSVQGASLSALFIPAPNQLP